MAICDKAGTVHFVVDGHPAVLGIVEFMAESFRRQWHPNLDISTVPEINCLPLQDLLEIILVFYFDFFSLDVEGGKLAVLQTVDFKKVFEFFGVIVIEADDHNPEKNQSVKDVLLANGFDYFSHIGANDWFVNKKFTHCDDAKLQ